MENAKREESERKKEKRKATTQNEQASCKKQDSKPEKPTFKQLFESFQRQALFQASVNDGLCMETHMYELLSLQDIILLKQSQYSPSVRNHFGEELLQTLYDELRTSLYDKTKKFGEEISLVQDIIYVCLFITNLHYLHFLIVVFYIRITSRRLRTKQRRMDRR
ncbi:uncharacterized protein RHIMIDRAFT_19638 [Rhizopus microsporus ATCC 52813]|uniref:Uncharacterized protein n=1 Tax=Rhizopus microsporus ATCC 52813 TaxID=1340429 RepID=A0A2G4SSY1_RHIZD|nr:uncharacterized protein RHIMIDRAFT_19638 [Rhizopus microsporus ATCC 52813]PHZ11861.1 hypothetical protein RHIMIDRAFT_19638 [Rhizopus microsporus ATCC 52813]